MNQHYYDPSTFTWGYELELGDINRATKIPPELGNWEFCETDIVNTHGDYAGVACDPQGVEPPYGGEINTKPTTTVEAQVKRIMQLIRMFQEQGDNPSASCVNHGHLHVHVPGLRDDINGLKRLTKYIKENQHIAIKKAYQYEEHPRMSQCKTARTYLKWDGGRPMPDWMCNNIIEKANNFADFIDIQCCGKDGVSRGRPFRYAINTYCLKHTTTIEFRCFRASLEEEEIRSCFLFAKQFISAALNDGAGAEEILQTNNFRFPPFVYNHEHYSGWEKTKWPKSRGKKERKYLTPNA